MFPDPGATVNLSPNLSTLSEAAPTGDPEPLPPVASDIALASDDVLDTEAIPVPDTDVAPVPDTEVAPVSDTDSSPASESALSSSALFSSAPSYSAPSTSNPAPPHLPISLLQKW